MRSPTLGPRTDTEADLPMNRPSRLTGLQGSSTSYVQFADAPARPDTPASSGEWARSSSPGPMPDRNGRGDHHRGLRFPKASSTGRLTTSGFFSLRPHATGHLSLDRLDLVP